MKNKTWIFVAGALVIYAAFNLLSGGVEQRVVKVFEQHQAALEQEMEAYLENGTLAYTENWKAVNAWPGEHDMVEYIVTASGMVSESTYYGFYYSADDVPLAFQNTDVPLAESEVGWVWTAEGDNRGRTYRLEPNWFYFEASF